MQTVPACALLLSALVLSTRSANAQSGGFIATLGNDTVHVERFTLDNGVYRGRIVTRIPKTRVLDYTIALSPTGGIARYDVATFDGNHQPLTTNGSAGSMALSGDSLIRVSLRDGRMDTVRMAAPPMTVMGASIPYVGTSYLAYEMAFAQMRARGDSSIYQLTMIPQQAKPGAAKAWLVGSDSAELNYFNVARSGYKFDASGKLIRADWRNTTYRYRIERTSAPDVDAIAKRWTDADANGASFGALSPRDTVKSTIGGSDITLAYGRPAARGRRVWGDVVNYGKVWRLGADYATQITTTKDLRVGDADIPAGSYTLWMLLSETGESKLIVNSAINIFGTQYNPAKDFTRITLTRAPSAATERLQLSAEGGALSIRWGDAVWSAPIVAK